MRFFSSVKNLSKEKEKERKMTLGGKAQSEKGCFRPQEASFFAVHFGLV